MSKSARNPGGVLKEPTRVLEDCPTCEETTAHAVSIEIREESSDGSQTAYSREPYRVSVCQECEETERLRMNDQ